MEYHNMTNEREVKESDYTVEFQIPIPGAKNTTIKISVKAFSIADAAVKAEAIWMAAAKPQGARVVRNEVVIA
jgi:hypothetical protein